MVHKPAGRVVVSGYQDLQRLHPRVEHIHLRKFASKRLLESIIASCPHLRSISMSRYAYLRCSWLISLDIYGLEIAVSKRKRGRPNLMETTMMVRPNAWPDPLYKSGGNELL
ncbi:MAG: hypothetical protein HY519_01755 [Candidatus Aenigmarchaeota archaeon]|nr:hypothetical protein [Candidatus Aenigmarchaeota archaeon]